MSVRLNKYISDSGFCSRREADKLIEQNNVTINGKAPELGAKVVPGDRVFVDGKRIKNSDDKKTDRVYLAYNKPIGITCTTERHVVGNIIDAIGYKQRIFPVGRLDKPSEGLIFLTSDGDIVNKILRAENGHDKEYIVKVNKPVNEHFARQMSKGIPILNTVTKPCEVVIQSQYVFKIILTEGLNRQIRRMCEYLGYEVTKLKRVRIMNVQLGKLKPGQYRNLTLEELEETLADSTKTIARTAKKKIAARRLKKPENTTERKASGKSLHVKPLPEQSPPGKSSPAKKSPDKKGIRDKATGKTRKEKPGADKSKLRKKRPEKARSKKIRPEKTRSEKVRPQRKQSDKKRP